MLFDKLHVNPHKALHSAGWIWSRSCEVLSCNETCAWSVSTSSVWPETHYLMQVLKKTHAHTTNLLANIMYAQSADRFTSDVTQHPVACETLVPHAQESEGTRTPRRLQHWNSEEGAGVTRCCLSRGRALFLFTTLSSVVIVPFEFHLTPAYDMQSHFFVIFI